MAPRAIVAKRRHPRDDERWKALSQRIGRKAKLLVEPAAARIQENVGARHEPQHRRFPLVGIEIEDDGTLAAVVGPKIERLLLVDLFVSERGNEPRRRSPGRLDLDDLRPKPGKQQTAIFGCLVGIFDDGQAGKHSRSVGWSKSIRRCLALGCWGGFLGHDDRALWSRRGSRP